MENNVQNTNQNQNLVMLAHEKKLGKERLLNKNLIIMIILAILALAGVGFGIFGMVSGGSKVSDLEQKLVERDETIAKLQGGDGVSSGNNDEVSSSNNPSSDNHEILAKKLLIQNPDQALNTKMDSAFIWNLNVGDSNLLSLSLQKSVGGLTDFQKEYDAESGEIAARISGAIDCEAYGLVDDVCTTYFEMTDVDADKVVDMAVIQFGNGIVLDDLMAFFLMDDGTVEYMPVKKALSDGKYKSYGKVSDVENVIKFMKGSVVYGPYANQTVLAQRADGKFYDLWENLRAMNEI